MELRFDIRKTYLPVFLHHFLHQRAAVTHTNMATPTLKLDPQAKVAPLAPIALAKLVTAADASQALTLVFEDGIAPTLILPNAAPVEGYLHIIRELASHYAHLGLSGTDKDQSAQVNLYVSQGDNLALANFQTALLLGLGNGKAGDLHAMMLQNIGLDFGICGGNLCGDGVQFFGVNLQLDVGVC